MAKNTEWPIPKFYFIVEISNVKQGISFQEVSGLEQEVEVLKYRHGKSKATTFWQRTGLNKVQNIVCKKGIFKKDDQLIELFNEVIDNKYAPGTENVLELSISLLDELAETVMKWNVSYAIPVKISGPNLKSDANEVAIESIEFAHSGIVIEIGK